jgi:hypothetical protein
MFGLKKNKRLINYFSIFTYNLPNLHTLWDGYIAKYKLKNLDIHIYPSPHHDIKYKSSD